MTVAILDAFDTLMLEAKPGIGGIISDETELDRSWSVWKRNASGAGSYVQQKMNKGTAGMYRGKR
jgi:hypothetical protein